jgi:epoxide hydrolase
VPDADLDDLRSRLARTRWPEAECVDDWSQGMPLAYTRELADYWANDMRSPSLLVDAHQMA